MRSWLAGAVVGGLGGGLVAALLVLALVPQVTRAAPDEQVQPVVRAQRFELRDRNGILRGVMDLNDEGAAYVQLEDQDEVPQAEMTVSRQQARIRLGGPGSNEQVALSVEPYTGLGSGHEAAVTVYAGRTAQVSMLAATPTRGNTSYANLSISAPNAGQEPRLFVLDTAGDGATPVWMAPWPPSGD